MKKLSISITNPCYENWDAMTPEGKGKFCGSCQKTVLDFSAMSDRAIFDYFQQPAGLLCGRFMPDQLDRLIEPPPAKRVPWLRYMFTMALPAFLVSCKFVGRQALQGKVHNQERQSVIDTVVGNLLLPPVVGEPMPAPARSVVTVEDAATQKDRPEERKCGIQEVDKESISAGTTPVELEPIVLKEEEYANASVVRNGLSGVMGGISVSGIRMKKETPSMALPIQKPAPPVSAFVVYPNPATQGAAVTIALKSIEPGVYDISIVNSGGAVLQHRKAELSKESSAVPLNMKMVTAGAYLITITNAKSAKCFTQTLIVQ